MNCPLCGGAVTYQGVSSIECGTSGCANYGGPKCSICETRGLKSTIAGFDHGFTTAMFGIPYRDANGKYHYHDPNWTTSHGECSAGHRGLRRTLPGCPHCDHGQDIFTWFEVHREGEQLGDWTFKGVSYDGCDVWEHPSKAYVHDDRRHYAYYFANWKYGGSADTLEEAMRLALGGVQ